MRVGSLASGAAPRIASGSIRPDIEGLRGLAILLVVFYHAGFGFARGGFRGVDSFFVLSGYLITGLLLSEAERARTVSLANFWARRARRLLPAAALAILATLIVCVVLYSPFIQASESRSALGAALNIANLVFARSQLNYFAQSANRDLLLHTWSLAIEEQFYLVFAPLVLVVAATTRRLDRASVRTRLQFIVAAIAAFSAAIWLIQVRREPIAAFYGLPARSWEFGAGALLATMPRSAFDRLNGRPADRLAVAALVALLVAAVFDSDGTGGLALTALAVGGTVVILASGISTRCPANLTPGRVLGSRSLRAVGRVSYSWYLWHWPMLLVALRFAPMASPIVRLVAEASALIPAVLAYLLVEQPMRYSKWLSRSPGRSLTAAAALMSSVAGAALVVRYHALATLRRPESITLLRARELPRLYADGCNAWLQQDRPRFCSYGRTSADTTIVLFGDSHAAQWFPAVDGVAQLRGWRLVPITKSSCPAVLVTVSVTGLGHAFAECDRWRTAAFAGIAALHPAVVLVANSHGYTLIADGQRTPVESDGEALIGWSEGLARVIGALQRSGAKVVVLQDTPAPKRDLLDCIGGRRFDFVDCAADRAYAVDTIVATVERSVVKMFPRAAYVDLNDLICTTTICPATYHGIPIYRDEQHISGPFAASLAAALDSALVDSGALTARTHAPEETPAVRRRDTGGTTTRNRRVTR